MTPSVHILRDRMLKAGLRPAHLFVVPDGYLLQINHEGKSHSRIVPFDFKEDAVDRELKEFLKITKEKIDEPKRPRRKSGGNRGSSGSKGRDTSVSGSGGVLPVQPQAD